MVELGTTLDDELEELGTVLDDEPVELGTALNEELVELGPVGPGPVEPSVKISFWGPSMKPNFSLYAGLRGEPARSLPDTSMLSPDF